MPCLVGDDPDNLARGFGLHDQPCIDEHAIACRDKGVQGGIIDQKDANGTGVTVLRPETVVLNIP